MAETKKEEMANNKLEKEGKKVLGGVIILFWVVSVLAGIATFSFNTSDWIPGSFYLGPVAIGLPLQNQGIILPVLALFVVALVGLYVRKSWAVPVGRAGLVVTMVVFFPVGTIFGGIVWKRYNDPIAKMYLNYPVSDEEKEELKELESKKNSGEKSKK